MALVLSGGGARGGVHVGVLKVLEENKIPIDMIVGTSMGSFVGGLYASGKTPHEIEQILVSSDWKEFIRTNFERSDTPMKRKQIEDYFQGRLALGINKDKHFVLPTGVFKRQPLLLKFLKESEHVEDIQNFDNLSIPFRAVATNIENGEAVVLKSGSLGRAMYASSAIPGGFQPIRIDNKNLVDGGISKNLPISVAKEMQADIIIAVDASESFEKEIDINSYLVVMDQLVNILMRKNTDDEILMLTSDDVLISPYLNGYSGLDVDKYAQIIEIGEAYARDSLHNYEHLKISDEDYEKYLKKHRFEHHRQTSYIDEIIIENNTYISNEMIKDRLHVKVGDILDECVLRKNMMHIYNMMIFDSVEYELIKKGEKNTVVIKTTPSWDNRGEVRFSFGFEDDYNGASAYSFKMAYRAYGINSYGGEFNSDFEIGKKEQIRSEVYQPIDSIGHYYVRPNFLYVNQVDKQNNDLDFQRYGISMALGRYFFVEHELEFGVGLYKDTLESFSLGKKVKSFRSRPTYVSFRSDTLDNINFPKYGYKSNIVLLKEMSGLKSDYDYEQVSIEVEKPFNIQTHNLTAYLKLGMSLNNSTELSLLNKYTLGGLFNLSGYAPNTFYGNNLILGVLKYRYEIKNGGFFGTFNAPLYMGFSIETGDIWDEDKEHKVSQLKQASSIYIAADTFLGALYLAYGASSDGQTSAYLYLGEKF